MNRKFSLLTAGIAALFLFACGDDNVVEGESPIETKAKLNVVVQDASTQLVLKDAKVTLQSSNKSAKTSETGAVSFDNLNIGDYIMHVEKAGYASKVVSGSIDGEKDPNGNFFLARTTSSIVALPPLTASLEGYLRYNNASGVPTAANGAKALLVLTDGEIINKSFEATADSKGKYTFSDLPATGGDQYTIYALEHTFSGTTYPTQVVGYGNQSINATSKLLAGQSAFVGYHSYSVALAPFDLVSYTREVSENGALVFTFSDEIDASKFSSGLVTVSGVNATNYNVALDGETITLTPTANGTWGTAAYFTVAFSSLTSIKGTVLPNEPKTVNNSQFALVDWTRNINNSDEIVLEFNANIDASKFSSNLVTITYNNRIDSLAFDADVKGKKLTLTPKAGVWNSNPNATGITEIRVDVRSLTSSKNIVANFNRDINLLYEDQLFTLTEYPKNVAFDGAITFEFSDEIDLEKFGKTLLTVGTSNGNNNLPFNYDVEDNKLTLTPAYGKWSTTPTATVATSISVGFVNGGIKSVKNIPYANNSIQINVFSEGRFVVVGYPRQVDFDGDIVIEFNEEIEEASFRKSFVSLSQPIPFNYELDGKNLILTPAHGKWSLTPTSSLVPQFRVTLEGIISSSVESLLNTQTDLIIVNGVFERVSYTANVAFDGEVIIEFSDKIDAKKFDKSFITLIDIYNTSLPIPFDFDVDDNKLILTPGNERWSVTSGSATVSHIGVTLSENIVSAKGINNTTTTSATIEVRTAGAFNMLPISKSEIERTDDIVLEFTDDINPESPLLNIGVSTGQVVKKTIKGNTITLTPLEGEWDNYGNGGTLIETFNVTGLTGGTAPNITRIISVKGVPYTSASSLTFTIARANLSSVVIKDLKKIDSTKVGNPSSWNTNWNSTIITLEWSKVEDAAGYRVYAKASGGSLPQRGRFNSLGTAPLGDYLDPDSAKARTTLDLSNYTSQLGVAYQYNAYNFFSNNNEIEIFVVPFNGKSEGSLTTANAIVVEDHVTPKFSSGYLPPISPALTEYNTEGYTYFGYGSYNTYPCYNYNGDGCDVDSWATALSNGLYSDQASDIGTHVITFSEPMDTTDFVAEFTDVVPNRLVIETSWNTTGTQLTLTLKANAGPKITSDIDVTYKVSELKDRRGNEIDGFPYRNNTRTRRTVEFWFQATAQ